MDPAPPSPRVAGAVSLALSLVAAAAVAYAATKLAGPAAVATAAAKKSLTAGLPVALLAGFLAAVGRKSTVGKIALAANAALLLLAAAVVVRLTLLR